MIVIQPTVPNVCSAMGMQLGEYCAETQEHGPIVGGRRGKTKETRAKGLGRREENHNTASRSFHDVHERNATDSGDSGAVAFAYRSR